MKQLTQTDIEQLVRQFEAHTLPKEEWTHQAHLVVGFWYAWHNDFSQALLKLRKGITSYNESVGTPNTDNMGYHETITQYWLILIYWYMEHQESRNLENALNQFLNSPLRKKYGPLAYYSKGCLFSPLARKSWVKPDKKPLKFTLERNP